MTTDNPPPPTRRISARPFLITLCAVLLFILVARVWRGGGDGEWFESEAEIQIEIKDPPPFELSKLLQTGIEKSVDRQHIRTLTSKRFIDSTFDQNESLSKTPTFKELTADEAVELIRTNLVVTPDPQDPTILRMKFRSRNAVDSRRVLQSLISTYRQSLWHEFRDWSAEQFDHTKTNKHRLHARKDKLESQLQDLGAFDTDSMIPLKRTILLEIRIRKSELAKSTNTLTLVSDCLEQKDSQSAERMLWMLAEWGEFMEDNPFASGLSPEALLKNIQTKVTAEIGWKKAALAKLDEEMTELNKETELRMSKSSTASSLKQELAIIQKQIGEMTRLESTLSSLRNFDPLDFNVIKPAHDGIRSTSRMMTSR